MLSVRTLVAGTLRQLGFAPTLQLASAVSLYRISRPALTAAARSQTEAE